MKPVILLVLIFLVSCTAGETPRPTATPTGPPSIQFDTVDDHSAQLDEELPDRIAGSQQEFAAATYITAHLQQAGYVVEFDSVPVANTVRSTNVVALPPSTEDPEYLVAVAYDNRGGGGGAVSIAVFLELARALRASVPEHSVEFVAMGAEAVDIEGGHLGSRRMIKVLEDRDLTPRVIQLYGVARSRGEFVAEGADGEELMALAGGTETSPLPFGGAVDIFEQAGLDATLVSGLDEEVAPIVLRFLASNGR